MATIENRSRTQITVKDRDDLTKLFPHTKNDDARAYRAQLVDAGFKPVVKLLDEAYLVRFVVDGKRRNFTASSEAEATATAKQIEAEHSRKLFVDYTAAHHTTLADLLIRYLKEEAPGTKGFLVLAYQINSWLSAAGLPRQDIAEIHRNHPCPYSHDLHIPAPSGRRMSKVGDAARFIRKAFAALKPTDFNNYTKARLKSVKPATVDREMDVLRAVCTFAINTWRIAISIHPMSGVVSPAYFNERDRRLVGDEYSRLIAAAIADDRECAIEIRTQELLATTYTGKSETKYQRLKLLAKVRLEAEQSYQHVSWYESFIEFQLMAGPRRSETLNLTWSHVNLDEQTAFLPDTKNGRSRTLPLRSDLVALLRQLPRRSESDEVFQFSMPQLRKAWTRICSAAKISTEGYNGLHIHDLRHEAISRVAEAGSNTPGGFTLADLQAFSGHRDVRMLMRYTSLMPKALARRLDAAFSDQTKHTTHQGRRRLTEKSEVTMAELVAAQPSASEVPPAAAVETSKPAVVRKPPDIPAKAAASGGRVLHVAFPQHRQLTIKATHEDAEADGDGQHAPHGGHPGVTAGSAA